MMERKKIIDALPKCQWIASALLTLALILWFLDPSPPAYLIAYIFVGVLWFICVNWMWRQWHFLGTIVALFFMAFYQLPDRFFDIQSQTQEVQAVFLALAVCSFLLYLLRRQVVIYSRLNQNAE